MGPLAEIVPTTEFPPAIPFTSHAIVALAARQNDAVNVCVWPGATFADCGEIELVVPHVIVTVAAALDAPPPVIALAVAWIVTGLVAGELEGAVYTAVVGPLAEIVPTTEFPPAIPFTSHAMEAPAARQNEAVNGCVCPSATFAAAGETEALAPHVMVTIELANFVSSATLVAVTVTVEGVGTAAGAVYSAVVEPVDTIVPNVTFPPAAPFTDHVTSALSLPLPVTVTENSCPPPAATLALGGAMTTSISVGGCCKLGGVPAVPQPTCTLAKDHKRAQRIHRAFFAPPNRVVPSLFTCRTESTHRTCCAMAEQQANSLKLAHCRSANIRGLALSLVITAG